MPSSRETSDKMEGFDLVIIGAGLYGVQMAKTYSEINPSARIVVLDAGLSIGGTWGAERIYDGLRSNNLVGMYEFSGFPMDVQNYGVPPGSHMPGTVVHRYLTSYAEHHGLFAKIRFAAKVKSAELQDDGSWIILYDWKREGENAQEMKITAKKLVMATGTTSEPKMPIIEGSEDFVGHIFHTKELHGRKEDMAAAKNVVVLGGSKSAADAVHMNASGGRHVDWVIRSSGRGPSWMGYPFVSPLKLEFEKLATTRAMSFLSPCFDFDGYPTIRNLLHNTALGRAFLRLFFGIIDNDVATSGRYRDHPETKKLLPRSSIFWSGTSVGVFNYGDNNPLFKLIKEGMITVHVADITKISPHTVHLADGNDLPADILICATGWKQTPSISFLPNGLSNKIGLSTAPSTDSTVQAADAEIFRRFPELKDQPATGPRAQLEREQASYALYRATVPPAFLSSRNLAYMGMAVNIRGTMISEVQALWVTAFLDNKLSVGLPSEEAAAWDAMLQRRFYRWRAPNGLGAKSPDMVFEMIPFVDTLLRDLGLRTRRKGAWWRELFEYYGVNDYEGLVGEWLGNGEEKGKRE